MVEGEACTSLPAAISNEGMLHILMLLIYKDPEDHHSYIIIIVIKTHDSESRGQEETAIIRETKNTLSYLQGNPLRNFLTL